MHPTAVLLAFANDWVDDQRHLRGLLEESKAIDKALAPMVETGAVVVPSPIHNATVDEVVGAFRKRQYRDRIRIFHFGGHASGSMLLFEDQAGRPSGAHAGGLAGYLGKQRGLVLVFLNGCCTEPQVRRLRDAGIHAVVATTSSIQDGVAAEFAAAFYAELATRSLREAYETAVQAVRLRSGDDPRSVTRDIRDVGDVDGTEPPPWPWIFDCAPEYEGWTLASELARRSRRTWRRRLLLAAAALPLLWMVMLGHRSSKQEHPRVAIDGCNVRESSDRKLEALTCTVVNVGTERITHVSVRGRIDQEIPISHENSFDERNEFIDGRPVYQSHEIDLAMVELIAGEKTTVTLALHSLMDDDRSNSRRTAYISAFYTYLEDTHDVECRCTINMIGDCSPCIVMHEGNYREKRPRVIMDSCQFEPGWRGGGKIKCEVRNEGELTANGFEFFGRIFAKDGTSFSAQLSAGSTVLETRSAREFRMFVDERSFSAWPQLEEASKIYIHAGYSGVFSRILYSTICRSVTNGRWEDCSDAHPFD